MKKMLTAMTVLVLALLLSGCLFSKKEEVTLGLPDIREVASLVSVSLITDLVVAIPPEASGSWNLPFMKKSYLAVGEAEILIGIDVNKIEEYKVNDGVVTVKLPEPEIIKKSFDPEKWTYWDDGTGIFRKVSPKDVHKAEAIALQQLEDKLRRSEVMEVAHSNAKRTIEKFLLQSGAREVLFE
ncbi:DUF4230 domain-containing protein [Heliorestis convoluta]|uniref:DUF4230 domain-containing protein n=1 Tax=Heliorestis convoluta TaxID=356322 RepID=A0A5Q2N653_9FIRM|nr:DUF4230 domain-containing protein [Heliorestis convoluta]QGG49423.1 hypothetical protein FTV88_3358 [Heliorestis convoluta]